MRTVILCLTLISSFAAAQSAPQPPAPPITRPKKVLTPEQITYQAQLKNYNAELFRLRDAANAAYDAEIAREKVPMCRNVVTTYDSMTCLSKEYDITDANFKAFTTALRAMLALPAPIFPGETTHSVGPSGAAATPADKAAAFDAAEAAWHTYATAECNAIDTFWRGGTIVNSMVGECSQRLARARLHELDAAYGMPLHH